MITKAQHEASFADIEKKIEEFIDSEIRRQAGNSNVYIRFENLADWTIMKRVMEKYQEGGWRIEDTGGRDLHGEPIPHWKMT